MAETITAKEYRKLKHKPLKYRNKPIIYDNQKFDSIKEKDRYLFLKTLETVGEIKNLRRQVKYILLPKTKEQRETCYYADYVYAERNGNGEWKDIVEDVKSSATKTQLFKLKKKLMKAKHNITIREV